MTLRKVYGRIAAWRRAGMVLCVLLMISEVAMGQETTEVEPQQSSENSELKALEEEVARLTLEKQRAEALKAIAEASQAAVKASLPETETSGKAGDVTIQDGAGYYAELMAYETLGTSADEILKQVQAAVSGKTVIVTKEEDLSKQAAFWEVIHLKIGRFQDEFDHLVETFDKEGKPEVGARPESVAVVAATLSSFLGAAADITAFFKVDREITARSVTLSERALVAEVARRLAGNTAKVLLPDLAVAGDRALLSQLEAAQSQKNEVVRRFEAIRKRLGDAGREAAARKAEWTKLKQPKASPEKVAAAKQALERAQAVVQDLTGYAGRFEAVIKAFDAFVDALTTAPAGGAKTPLETVAVVDLTRQHPSALLLYLDIPSQGAEIHITKSVWSSGRISYIGGSVAVYFLVDQEGRVLVADSLPRSGAASFKGKMGSGSLPPVPSGGSFPQGGGGGN